MEDEPFEDTGAGEDAARHRVEIVWPLRPWLSAGLLGLAGLAIHFLIDQANDSGPRMAAAAFIAFAAGAFVFTMERWRLLAPALFSLVTGLVVGGLTWRAVGAGNDIADSGYAVAAGVFACLLAADEVFDKAGVSPGEDPELAQLRERLDEVERERDLLETALSSATDARGRLERDLRAAREEADSRSNAEASAQAERIATLEKRCADLQHRLEDAQMQELPLTGGSFRSAGEELLPALERFAGLLESCADKLEGGPGNA